MRATWIFEPRRSFQSPSENPLSAHLAAAYIVSWVGMTFDANEETLTIAPPPCRNMGGIAAKVVQRQDRKFTRIESSASSTLIRYKSFRTGIAALLTRTSIRP